MMPTELEGRAQYLSVALFAQNLVAELTTVQQSGDPTKLQSSLSEALKSLKDVESGDVSRFGRRDAVAFNSYQQLNVLTNAWSDDERQQAILLIEQMIQHPDRWDDESSKLIDLFTRLQVQALWSFEQPEAPPTEGLRELCRMTP